MYQDYIERGTPEFRRTAFAFFAAGFNTFAILYAAQPLLPIFVEKYNVDASVSSLSLTLTTLTLALSMLIFGSLSEALGRKNIMIISMVAASVLCILTAFSPNFESLLVLRALQGVALAGVPSIAMAYISEEIHPRSLALAMGLYISGNSLGAVFGRVLSGILGDMINWQAAVLVIGLISMAATIVFIKSLRPSRHFTAEELNIKALAGYLIHHLKNPVLLCLYGIGFLLLGINMALFSYVTFVLLGAPYSLSQSLVSWIFLILLIGTVSSALTGTIVTRLGKVKSIYTGLGILSLGIILLFIPNMAAIIIGMCLFTYGFFLSHSIVSGLVGENADGHKAQASSLYLFFYYSGSAVIATLGGVFWNYSGWNGVIYMTAACAVLSFILIFTAIKLKRVQTAGELTAKTES
ncbi:MFS transporter [Corticicoccus populi]|uniref:MFS transporter n=1 Tax=Corticicoccus populi TaxID=1812821 RepID=A0ABW5WWV9_9STAP